MTSLASLLHRRIHRAAATATITTTAAAAVAGRQLSTAGTVSSRVLAAVAVGLLWLYPPPTSGSLICSTIRPLVAMISFAHSPTVLVRIYILFSRCKLSTELTN